MAPACRAGPFATLAGAAPASSPMLSQSSSKASFVSAASDLSECSPPSAGPSRARVLLLHSSTCSTKTVEGHQRRLRDLLHAKRVPFEEIDGSDATFRAARDVLWKSSGKRALYPQLFILRPGAAEVGASNGAGEGGFEGLADAADRIEFVGAWEPIDGGAEGLEAMCEADDIPAELLDANPSIRTFNRYFADLVSHP